jgi:8-oxo-dGTP diphosphatase
LNHPRELLRIAIGILRNTKNEVLLGKRMKGKNLEGYWEFPGGKIKSNETPEEALFREFQEELGVKIGRSKQMESIGYQYENYDVLLMPFNIVDYVGYPVGLEGQELMWCTTDQLREIEILPADQPLVEKLILEL